MSTHPSTAAAWYQRGLEALELSRSADTQSELRGDRESAVEAFDRALALEPQHAQAQYLRGRTLADLDRHEEALDSLAVAQQLLPDDPSPTRAAAHSFHRLGRHLDALAAAEHSLARAPRDADLAFLRAELLTRLHRSEAVSAWDELLADAELLERVSRFGARVRARLLRATTLAFFADGRAREAFDALFELEGEQLRGPMTPNELFDALRDFDVARKAFTAAIEHRPTAASWHVAVDHWLRAGRAQEALAAAERLVTLSPTDARAWTAKAEAHAAAGQRDAAITCFQRALGLEPDFLGAKARLEVVSRGGR